MALKTAEEIKKLGYNSKENTVAKYYLNAPYKHYRNYKRLSINGRHDIVMSAVYPYNVNYYMSDYGCGYEIDHNQKVIVGEVVVKFRGIEYNIEYYSKEYLCSAQPVMLAYAKLVYKKNKTVNNNKVKYVPEYRTAEFISNEEYHRLLPIQKPMFAIDENLVRYILTINKEEYGDFHRRVCKACLDVLNKEY